MFAIRRRVQFAETDMAGVMHFANYFRIMEEVEHAFWRSVDSSVHRKSGDFTVSWPRVRAHCEYLSPVRFEEELDITLTVARVGEKSVEYSVEFSSGGRAVARGNVTAVCCRVSDVFEAIAIPGDARAALEALKASDT